MDAALNETTRISPGLFILVPYDAVSDFLLTLVFPPFLSLRSIDFFFFSV